MKIWVDADACPVVIKEILFKAARRTGLELILVANQAIAVPRLKNIHMRQVPGGFDVADNEIARCVEVGDLVITGDIPLAAEVIEKKAQALNPRGHLYTEETIKERLNTRDFMETLRASGVQTGGPKPLDLSHRQAFSNHLDKILARYNSKVK